MSGRARLALFAVGALGVALFLVPGLLRLDPFGTHKGPYANALNKAAPPERHAYDIVTAVNFDYRGVDTLGEEFILFTAVAGVVVLLREKHHTRGGEPSPVQEAGEGPPSARGGTPRPRPDAPPPTEAVRGLAGAVAGVTLTVGMYEMLLAHLGLGGGFQAGVILSGAWLLCYLAGSDRVFGRLAPRHPSEALEAVGAGAYALVGLAGLLAGAAYLQNVLPLGKEQSLLSAGTIPVINAAVTLEVAAGFVVLFGEFIGQIELSPDEVEKEEKPEKPEKGDQA